MIFEADNSCLDISEDILRFGALLAIGEYYLIVYVKRGML